MALPFFSIGVTTFNRRDLLRQSLRSLLEQTFEDFEVIVGNDFTQEQLRVEELGIRDPRVHVLNHPERLGQVGNMNSLLSEAHGRYFTWQPDDDLCSPRFLEVAHQALSRFDYPECLFTSYGIIEGTQWPDSMPAHMPERDQGLAGPVFLKGCLSNRLRTMGGAGVYNVEFLRSIGGVQPVTTSSIALYSEYLLLLQAGLLDQVIYIHAPLVLFRHHQGSWSGSNEEIEQYKEAGRNLVERGVRILWSGPLQQDFRINQTSLLRLHLNFLTGKLVASERSPMGMARQIGGHIAEIMNCFASLRGTPAYWMAVASLMVAMWIPTRVVLICLIKQLLPPCLTRAAQSAYRTFTGISHIHEYRGEEAK